MKNEWPRGWGSGYKYLDVFEERFLFFYSTSSSCFICKFEVIPTQQDTAHSQTHATKSQLIAHVSSFHNPHHQPVQPCNYLPPSVPHRTTINLHMPRLMTPSTCPMSPTSNAANAVLSLMKLARSTPLFVPIAITPSAKNVWKWKKIKDDRMGGWQACSYEVWSSLFFFFFFFWRRLQFLARWWGLLLGVVLLPKN